MRTFSRNMPARPDQTMGPGASCAAMGLFLALLALPGLAWWPLAFVFPAIFILGNLIGWHADKREAERRRGESICDFARSFDCRAIDPWIIRAVYEEFSDSYPIRANDHFLKDLRVDEEDFEDSIESIAKRIGRKLESPEPEQAREEVGLATVRDLVQFLQKQPKFA